MCNLFGLKWNMPPPRHGGRVGVPASGCGTVSVEKGSGTLSTVSALLRGAQTARGHMNITALPGAVKPWPLDLRDPDIQFLRQIQPPQKDIQCQERAALSS